MSWTIRQQALDATPHGQGLSGRRRCEAATVKQPLALPLPY